MLPNSEDTAFTKTYKIHCSYNCKWCGKKLPVKWHMSSKWEPRKLWGNFVALQSTESALFKGLYLARFKEVICNDCAHGPVKSKLISTLTSTIYKELQ